HIEVTSDILSNAHVSVNGQVRISLSNGGSYVGLYTIVDKIQEGSGIIKMGRSGLARLDRSDDFEAILDSNVVSPSLSNNADDATVESDNEFIERFEPAYVSKFGLIAMAPHGGGIELQTDSQASLVRTYMGAAKDVSTWICKGWRTDPYPRPEDLARSQS